MSITTSSSKLASSLMDRILGTAGRQRLSILIYHRVLEEEDYLRPDDPTGEEFGWQMALLARHCCPLPLAEALSLMDSGKLPDRAICVTFDDGYADNAEIALPILQRWKIPSTVFVSTGFLDGGRMWNDTVLEAIRISECDHIDLSTIGLGVFPMGEQSARKKSAHDILGKIKYLSASMRDVAVDIVAQHPAELPGNLMLSSGQLNQLRNAGVEIGAHTHTHPILASLTPEDALQEIAHSKTMLEQKLGHTVRFFAYPNGRLGSDYHQMHRSMVSEIGFEAALSTNWGVSDRNSDRWQLPRFTPWDSTSARFLFRLLINQRNVV